MEIAMCFAVMGILLFLYYIFGQTLFLCCRQKVRGGFCLLTGVFVYHALFQLEALPLTFFLQPLSRLTGLWFVTVIIVTALWIILRKKQGETISVKIQKPEGSCWLLLVMAVAVLVQMYYIVVNNYLGWDTTSYVGTINTSVVRNSMYRYNGETGIPSVYLNLRYALSSFYMHGAVWCQALSLRGLHFAKIVQGGMLAILANLTIYKLGQFLFGQERYQGILSKEQMGNCAAGMVIAAVFLNFFYKTIFTTSDFLLNRALEAKGYCANLILPFLFLLGLMMWRDCHNAKTRIMFFTVLFGSVSVSMSAMMSAPALATLLIIPVFIRERSWKFLRFYLICIAPNIAYAIVYLLYNMDVIRIRV